MIVVHIHNILSRASWIHDLNNILEYFDVWTVSQVGQRTSLDETLESNESSLSMY